MSLIPCPDCNHSCSDQAASCPQCGRHFKRHDEVITVSRKGWGWTIGWGVIASVFISILLSLAVTIGVTVLFGGLSSIGSQVK